MKVSSKKTSAAGVCVHEIFRHLRPVFAAAALSVFAAGCGSTGHEPGKFRYQKDRETEKLSRKEFSYPAARFAVLADPHYHHPDLGTSGPAFGDYISDDRKMLAKSDEILDSAISRVRKEDADFILICGDLTKDGEKENHLRVAEKIDNLHPSAPVFVVPGNHDVENGIACRYTDEGTEPVENVSPQEFEEIYADFGYSDPIYADTSSLSYVAEPVDGLWLLALDSCLWRENQPGSHPVTDGRFSGQTLEWIEDVLIRAKKREKAVIAFMHHGLVEHFPANEKYYGQYVVDDSEKVARLLSRYGVRLVFTGHFHAQDITVKRFDATGNCVFDIETGSLVTWPCPYRTVEITEQETVKVESRFIESIESMPEGFRNYAREFAFTGTVGLAEDTLENLLVSRQGIDILAPQIAEAYLAHLAGDEKKPEQVLTTQGTGLMGRVVAFFRKDLIEGWWTDLPPADNRLSINSGDCSRN